MNQKDIPAVASTAALDAVAALSAERDRYRDALGQIVEPSRIGEGSLDQEAWIRLAQETARIALEDQ